MKLICATRGRFEDTLLCKSVVKMRGTELTFAIAQNNTAGLSRVYNSEISAETLVFAHDDVVIPNFWWADVVEEGLKRFDIVGVAGNRRVFPDQRSWYLEEQGLGPDYLENLSGAVAGGTDWCDAQKLCFGPLGEVKTLDGVFIAANGKKLLEAGVTFDEDFDFHFYDMSFCTRARAAGLTLGTIPLTLVHNSKGPFDQRWRDALEVYRRKYG